MGSTNELPLTGRNTARNHHSLEILSMEPEIRELISHCTHLNLEQKYKFQTYVISVFNLLQSPVYNLKTKEHDAFIDLVPVDLFTKIQELVAVITSFAMGEDDKNSTNSQQITSLKEKYSEEEFSDGDIEEEFIPSLIKPEEVEYIRPSRTPSIDHKKTRNRIETLRNNSIYNEQARSKLGSFIKRSPEFNTVERPLTSRRSTNLDIGGNEAIKNHERLNVITTEIPRSFSTHSQSKISRSRPQSMYIQHSRSSEYQNQFLRTPQYSKRQDQIEYQYRDGRTPDDNHIYVDQYQPELKNLSKSFSYQEKLRDSGYSSFKENTSQFQGFDNSYDDNRSSRDSINTSASKRYSTRF
ncbi:hypothetical protein WICMUC_004788 [Wickerhamomyces mucosus]|uniref:Uncharacterized protein n=1 Tax=Wickerhamomyces mucosus TaxID=1378264 RepID=A0A9P8T9P4_9ASCO|nr:hypothetical protein WICMUC_004788 [Wickerhamomyces mucosus]